MVVPYFIPLFSVPSPKFGPSIYFHLFLGIHFVHSLGSDSFHTGPEATVFVVLLLLNKDFFHFAEERKIWVVFCNSPQTVFC